ncbi:hypothetical protein [Nocardioides alkalitolerans]|uniref:hypothetical protein n=1 Tax=Nocardioides alkalitolerans TaxID=281714 RepID=UPI0004275CF6|nr:hypothetical protein [Nocardioides alkalitolerans]
MADDDTRPAPAATTPPPTGETDGVRRFALNEDWAATGVGLAIVLLAAAGVITEGWLPL